MMDHSSKGLVHECVTNTEFDTVYSYIDELIMKCEDSTGRSCVLVEGWNKEGAMVGASSLIEFHMGMTSVVSKDADCLVYHDNIDRHDGRFYLAGIAFGAELTGDRYVASLVLHHMLTYEHLCDFSLDSEIEQAKIDVSRRRLEVLLQNLSCKGMLVFEGRSIGTITQFEEDPQLGDLAEMYKRAFE